MSYQRSNVVIRMKVRPNPVYSSIIFKLKVWGFLTSHWSGHFFRKFDIRKIQICPWALVWVFHTVHLVIKPQTGVITVQVLLEPLWFKVKGYAGTDI